MKKTSLIPVVAEFHTATAAAVKVRFLVKPGVRDVGPVWIGRSKLQGYKDLPDIEGHRYVRFNCPSWIIRSHGILAGNLKKLYDKQEANKIDTFVTHVREITHRLIPNLERKGGKIDQNLRRIIQQSEKFLEDEKMMPFPSSNFKTVDGHYRRAISAYRKLVMKNPAPPKAQPAPLKKAA